MNGANHKELVVDVNAKTQTIETTAANNSFERSMIPSESVVVREEVSA